MSWLVRKVAWPWRSVLLLCLGAVSCAAEGGATQANGAEVPRIDKGGVEVPESGCSRVLIAASDKGCRGDWICDNGATLSLLCAPTDAGTACVCVLGDGGTGATGPLDASCTEPSAVPVIANGLCDWSVP